MTPDADAPPLAVVLKGYPRLSETFIAQELKALEDRGLSFHVWSLRKPYDDRLHPIHGEIRAKVFYLPEYLHEEPGRVLAGLAGAMLRRGFLVALALWLADLVRDPSLNRIRRFGQACVLAREGAASLRFLYAHFLHTPASVARYAAAIRGLRWGFSAHARDIWTIPDWEKREKIADARFGVTCTEAGARHLQGLAADPSKIEMLHHGLDLRRFPAPAEPRPPHTGHGEEDRVTFLSVGRLVEKKGYRDLLAALADLPKNAHWRFVHIGDGPLRAILQDYATRLGIADRIDWRGKRDQRDVLAALREADVFVLAAKVAQDGDRDGLPNVLLEAASQNLPIVATRVGAIGEFVANERTGVLVRAGHVGALAEQLHKLSRDPRRREALGAAARERLEREFGVEKGVARIAEKLRVILDTTPEPGRTGPKAAP
jgi:glycosyltransferase involved in cell wall biosynthesis